MTRNLFMALLLGATTAAWSQVAIPPVERAQAFAYEDKDWGVAPTASEKRAPIHAPTPTSIPGGRVIRTLELKALLEQQPQVLVIDVLDTRSRASVPGAYTMAGAGNAGFYGAETTRFNTALEKLTGGDKDRPLVFLCISAECWQSYNASLRAMAAGYKDVIWYRGGSDAWKGASLELKPARIVPW